MSFPGSWISGGTSGISNIVEDTTPQLGGDLDLNTHVITGMEIGTDVLAQQTIGIADNNLLEVDGTPLDTEVAVFTATGINGLSTTEVKSLLTYLQAGDANNMADAVLTRPKLLDYSETVNALGDLGGGTDDIDLESGNVVTATVSTAEETFTFSNPAASGSACSFTLILTNGGSQTVNWPASVDWAGGTEPSLTAAGVDVLTFTTVDGGTIWYGFAAGLAMA